MKALLAFFLELKALPALQGLLTQSQPFFFLGTLVADENGSTEPIRAYREKTLVIVLPGDLTVFDIGNYSFL